MSTPFDDLTDVYEAMIDWPKRLANEAPFYRRLFERSGVRRVADVACGTGRHAAMFHSWGLEVLGADISPNMIRRARDAHGEPPGLRWAVQGYEQPAGEPGAFDAVVCLGNSLSLAPDIASAMRALGAMLHAVRPGGVVAVHVLNLWSLPSGPCIWQKVVRRGVAGRELTIVKGVHRCDATGWVELVLIPQEDGQPHHAQSVPFLGLRQEDFTAATRGAAVDVEFHGGVQSQPYVPDRSTDLIVVATRRA